VTDSAAETTINGILFLGMLRWLVRILFGALLLLALVYVGDFAVFTLRGKPQDQVNVNRYMAAPLKDNKTELYFESSGLAPCARALFPQAGLPTCWKLRKHPNIAEQP
jgi:hypothetical protein